MSWTRDLKDAARSLSRAKLFSTVAVLTLAIGIGAAAAVANLARGVILAPLPYPDQERLVLIWSTDVERDIQRWQVTSADFLDWRERATSFSAMAPFQQADYNYSGGTSPERVSGYRVGVDIFNVLGIQPVLGRAFATGDESSTSEHVVILGHGFWRNRLGADLGLLGSTIRLDDVPHVVVGVLPPGIAFPERDVDIWVPLRFDLSRANRVSRSITVVARVAPPFTVQQAQTEMGVLARALEEQYPASNSGTGVWVAPLKDELVGESDQRVLTLVGAVTLLLLVTCANLMGLLLIRWTDRRADLAIRTALGASRVRQLKTLLTESLLLGLSGGAGGLLIASALTKVTVRFVPSTLSAQGVEGFSAPLIGMTFVVSTVAAALFGVGPALGFSRTAPAELLRRRRVGPSAGTRRVQGGLVVGEIAVALALIVASGLLLRSIEKLSGQQLGFTPDQALVATVDLPQSRYGEDGAPTRFFEGVLGRVHSLPNVIAAGFASYAPMAGSGGMIYYEPPGSSDRSGPPDLVYVRMVTSRYLEALGTSLSSGRSFEYTDRTGAPPVAIVNQAFVSRYLSSAASVLGSEIPLDAFDLNAQVVGVLNDVRYSSLDTDPRPEIYLHEAQFPSYSFFTPRDLVVRSTGNPLGLAGPIRSSVAAEDPALPLFNLRTMRSAIGAGLDGPRFQMRLFAGFAIVALFLSSLGIFAVVQYSVRTRFREIGVRMALGAGSGAVCLSVIRRGVVLVASGVAIGLGGALALGTVMQSVLYETNARDPLTFVLATALVTAAGLLASYLPSLAATRVDLIKILKED